MRFLNQFKSIRIYAIVMTLMLSLYTWAQFKGVKIIGDDNASRETHKEHNAYYHK